MDSTTWWITGGFGTDSVLSSTEYFDSNTNQFNAFSDLDVPFYYHTMVKVNDTHVVLVGQQNSIDGLYIYDR